MKNFDPVQFDLLVSFISNTINRPLDAVEMQSLVDCIERGVKVDRASMQRLFIYMLEERKIEAIKEYRTIIDCSLTDAKDDIEMFLGRFWAKAKKTLLGGT